MCVQQKIDLTVRKEISCVWMSWHMVISKSLLKVLYVTHYIRQSEHLSQEFCRRFLIVVVGLSTMIAGAMLVLLVLFKLAVIAPAASMREATKMLKPPRAPMFSGGVRSAIDVPIASSMARIVMPIENVAKRIFHVNPWSGE
jgi:hypothetical protein